jgi:transposase-like protein
MEAPENLQKAIVYFNDTDRCFQYALNLRWPNGVVSCPRCGSEEHSFIKTRRIWFCKGCKKQFTLKVGTIFEDSPLGLDKWMCAFWMICNCKNGVSSCEIARTLGITQKSAWFMLHRIRKAMASDTGLFSGTVEMDETFIGGKVKNNHRNKRPIGPGASGKPVAGTAKAIVVGMVERGGRVRAEVVHSRTCEVLSSIAHNNIAAGSLLVTDEWGGYNTANFERAIINHAE